MRRRKRKTRSRQSRSWLMIVKCPLQTRASTPHKLVWLLLIMSISIMPHLVNPISQQQQYSRSKPAPTGHHFDDEPHTTREFVSINRTSRIIDSTNKTNVIESHNKQIILASPLKVVESKPHHDDQEEQAINLTASQQHPDDLLAIETNRSPVAWAHNRQQQLLYPSRQAAPYEADTNHTTKSDPQEELGNPSSVFLQSNTQTLSDNATQTLLMQLHKTPTLTPIYLRHALPPALRPHLQVAAFPHPASMRLNQTSTPSASTHANGYVNGQHQQNSFALLPSWPNVYITQREQTRPQPQSDPKVPMNYPDWSSVESSKRHQTSTLSRISSSSVEYAHQRVPSAVPNGRRANLTASEVEYEQEEPEKDNSQQQQQQQLEKSHQHWSSQPKTKQTPDAWAKLLRQAAKNNVMESLMFTNKSIVSLLCDTNNMLIKLKFKQPFYGSVETNLDPYHQCRLFGNGSQYYEMRIHLFDCGTRQETPRLFINNIQIQFRSNNSVTAQHRSRMPDESDLLLFAQDNAAEEFKTLICSYPPLKQEVGGSSNDNLRSPLSRGPISSISLFTNLSRSEFEDSKSSRNNEPKDNWLEHDINLSDRIVDGRGGKVGIGNTHNDDDPLAQLVYYEPILMIAGLIMLAIVVALALVSSAYIVRRRQRSFVQAQRWKQSSSASSSSSYNIQRASARYQMSPAQLANRRTPLVAPPLIGLSKEETLGRRATMKRYAPTTSAQVASKSTSPRTLKDKQDLLGRTTQTRRQNSLSSSDSSSSARGGDSFATSDSLEIGKKSNGESVTTIEIPFAGEKVTTNILLGPSGSDSQEAKLADNNHRVLREYKMSSQKVLEKTTSTYHQVRPTQKQASEIKPPINTISTQQEVKREPPQSPLPFGSIRSKLTGPEEYKRLQNIAHLFEETNLDQEPELHTRYRARIARTLSAIEFKDLKMLFQQDEVFRSNVVDSIDSETFTRKMRNNPKYASKFSRATWNLLEEILLDANMSKPALHIKRRPLLEKHFATPRLEPSKKPELPAKPHRATELATKKENRSVEPAKLQALKTQLSQVRVQRNGSFHAPKTATSSIQPTRQVERKVPRGAGETSTEVRVSQSNSTLSGRDGSTTINIDSITNVSSPRSFSAFTKSSFEQVTKYQEEEDSLPFMDEVSQYSVQDDQRSFSSSSLEEKLNKKRGYK